MNFELIGNFGTTLKDTSLVLSAPLASYPEPPSAAYNKVTLKALLRSARALNGLEKLPEALDVLSRLKVLEIELGQEKDDVGLKIREEVEGKIRKKERRAAELLEKNRRIKEGEVRMKEALLVSFIRRRFFFFLDEISDIVSVLSLSFSTNDDSKSCHS